MPTDQTARLHRLVGGDPDAADEVLALAGTTDSASVLVAAAMLSRDAGHLDRAVEVATGSRERQLVALARAHLDGDDALLDALVRDHLADHPDHLLAAWIAGRPTTPPRPRPDPEENPVSPLTTAPPRTTRPSTTRVVAHWMLSFVGFPLGGLAATALVGPVTGPGAALTGGLVTGAVLGVAQALALRTDVLRWALATALGTGVGLTVGASVVDFRTGLAQLALQGAVTGLGVGIAQSVLLVRRTGPVAVAWPLFLAATWALGWVVTTSVGVRVDEQFTVFGAAGAVTVTLLTAVLPLLLQSRPHHVALEGSDS